MRSQACVSCDLPDHADRSIPRHRELARRVFICAALLASGGPSHAVDLSAQDALLVRIGQSSLPGEAGSSDVTALAGGDFDCDGVDDLAVGSGFAEASGQRGAGQVAIGFGDPASGLRASGLQINQDSAGIAGVPEVDDAFGSSLAAADFNGDGCSDLAVGVSGEDVGDFGNAGGVAMLFGRAGGPNGNDDVFLPPESNAAPHGPASNHFKGAAVAAVDRFTQASSLPMLAISAQGHSSGAALGAGGVSVRRSASEPGELASAVGFFERNQFPSELGKAGDGMGYVLASGDFNGDGFGDVVASTRHVGGCAVAVPNSLCIENNGQILIHYGGASVSGVRREQIHQDTPGVPGVNRNDDDFGAALAVGDFDGNGFDDLAVGIPGKDLQSQEAAGSVVVLFGGSGGLLARAQDSLALAANSLLGLVPAEGERFGAALAAGDFDLDGVDDLVIGLPGARVGSTLRAGRVVMIPSAVFASGPIVPGRIFELSTPGTQDRYGSQLAVADFNDDGAPDLAVGVPGRRDGSGRQKGAAQLLFGHSDTATQILSIEPPTAAPGQTYRVRVFAGRTPNIGSPRIRGSLEVRASDGSRCTATLSSSGLGSCTLTAPSPRTLSITAVYPGALGYAPSSSTPRSYSVLEASPFVFQDGFED